MNAENEGENNILAYLNWNASCPFNINQEKSYYIFWWNYNNKHCLLWKLALMNQSLNETRNVFEESKQSPFWFHVDFKVACYKLGEETVHTIARQSIFGSITLSSLLQKGFFNLTITVVLLDPGRASLWPGYIQRTCKNIHIQRAKQHLIS